MGKYFGTDGFRGRVGEVLTSAHAFSIGRFLGARPGRSGRARITIGKDTRHSSGALELALAAGVTASGGDAYLLQVLPTPGVAYVTRTGDFDCGVMISASHNPYADNGIKLLGRDGEKLEQEEIAALERYLEEKAERFPFAVDDAVGVTVDHSAVRADYISHLCGQFDQSAKGLRIGLDPANGSASRLAAEVFATTGAEICSIHDCPNGKNINLQCGSTHIAALRRLVRERALDVGFAFDGDADRCIAVDERGEVVDGDGILYVMAAAMKERRQLNRDTVVTTVMSNLGLQRALEGLGIACEQTAVGDRYVWECMRAGGYTLGGEQSGHIILGRLAPTGDGVQTALQLLRRMCETRKPLSVLTAGLCRYPQMLKSVRVTDKTAAISDASVRAAVHAAAAQLGAEGRILLRASGTEPVVRVMVEAASPLLCRQCADRVTAALRKGGYLL